jgi:short-subunit dehydrogenase
MVTFGSEVDMPARNWTKTLVAGLAVGYAAARLLRRPSRKLAGQVVVVVGGSRSLGLAIARELADAGCRLAIAGRDERELSKARHELEARGAEVMTCPCDAGSRPDIDRLVATVRERYGAIDILVNVAGLIQVGPAASMTMANFHDALAVNFWGPLHAIDAVVNEMRARGRGRIVNITSIGGLIPVPHLLPYACAKAATFALSQGLGAELRKDGIAVTTVVPGLMRTGSVPHAFFKGDARRELGWFKWLATSPLTAMSADRAARRIVAATARGDSLVVLSLSAKLGRLTTALLPGFVRGLLALVNRLLASGPRDESAAERPGRALLVPRRAE